MNYTCSPGDMTCGIDVMIFVTGNPVHIVLKQLELNFTEL